MARDKLYHLIAGAGITAWFSLIEPIWLAVIAGITAGALKEVYDAWHPDSHTVDGLDFIVTGLGALLLGMVLITFKQGMA